MFKTYTLAQLSKYCRNDMSGFAKYRVALLGDCATQHLEIALKGYAYTQGLSLEVFNADYDQILAQIMDNASEMYRFQPNAALLYMCTEKLYSLWCVTAPNDRVLFAETTFLRIKEYWNCIGANCVTHIMQFTFVESDDFVFGNYALKQQQSFIYQIRKLNLLLMEECARNKSVFLVDLCGIQTQIGRDNLFEPKLYYAAKIPVSLSALPHVAAAAVDVIQSLRGVVIKCVVLDLDNTLWGGVIGDDGLSGIQIGELGLGRAFSEFQTWIKELKKRGILLAVCSKNEQATAQEPFENHDEMVLRLEDFSIFVANWEDKASNIRYIQQTLNIGMDSMVFIDDNPFERDLVRSMIPEIIVPDLPDDPAEYLTHLKRLNLFETASYSDADAMRTEQYQAETQRKFLQQQYANYDEYLRDLEMAAIARPFDEFHVPRIAQLTQRSNQFNLRTIRYTEAEIEAASHDPGQITFYFTLKDKLADHGLISVVILEKRDNKTLFINTWLMSCRVLKRGVEEFIVNKIVATAKADGFETVIGEYIKTPKNAMVEDVYERLGFTRTAENIFTANISNFKHNKTFVNEDTTELFH